MKQAQQTHLSETALAEHPHEIEFVDIHFLAVAMQFAVGRLAAQRGVIEARWKIVVVLLGGGDSARGHARGQTLAGVWQRRGRLAVRLVI